MRLLFLGLYAAGMLCAQNRQVVITVDDLPRGGDAKPEVSSIRAMTTKLVAALNGTHAIGFVNPGRAAAAALGEDGLQSILKVWLEGGLELGNHSYSHLNINKTSLAEYTADILKAEPALQRVLGKNAVYYRHPFLFTGQDETTKRDMQRFLDEHHYTVAPVTLDNADYIFAAVYTKTDDPAKLRTEYVRYMESIFAFFEQRSVEVTGREFPQILLLHANQLNADTMPELLAMMKRRGYKFVTLDTALRDKTYRLPDNYVGTWGISWIHRWAKTKGMPDKWEPEAPDWVMQAYKKLQ